MNQLQRGGVEAEQILAYRARCLSLLVQRGRSVEVCIEQDLSLNFVSQILARRFQRALPITGRFSTGSSPLTRGTLYNVQLGDTVWISTLQWGHGISAVEMPTGGMAKAVCFLLAAR